jgi:hypothetical protein
LPGRRQKQRKDSPPASLETQRHGVFEDGGSRKPAAGLRSWCKLEADEPEAIRWIAFLSLPSPPGKSSDQIPDLSGPLPGLLILLRVSSEAGGESLPSYFLSVFISVISGQCWNFPPLPENLQLRLTV